MKLSRDELKSLICEILSDKNLLAEFNDKLLSSKWKYSMEEHAKEIIGKIYKQ